MTILLYMTIAAAVIVAPIVTPWMRKNPKSLLASYLILGLFFPYWIGMGFGGQFLPLMFLLSVGALLVAKNGVLVHNWLDILLYMMMAICAVATVMGRSGSGHLLAVFGAWLIPYVLGRVMGWRVSVDQVCVLFAVAAGLLAVQAIVEFAFNWHPFVGLTGMSGPADVWSRIQLRGGFARSEGALGHSISMGNVLAISVPFIIFASIRPRLKVALISLVTAATMVTFSRNALVAVIAAIAISALFATPTKIANTVRVTMLSFLTAGTLLVAPVYLTAIAGGTAVLHNSNEYRLNYLSVIPDVAWFGRAPIYVQYGSDQWGWASASYPGGVIVTLDNTLLLFALQFGWIPMILLAMFLLGLLIVQIKGRNSPALIAVTSQSATILTVAMITQFAYIYWLVVGLAVTYHLAEKESVARGVVNRSGNLARPLPETVRLALSRKG